MRSNFILFPTSKGLRAKHFLKRSEYIKLIAPNGAFGFWGPISFEIYSYQTFRFKLVNWITTVNSHFYQNPKYIKAKEQTEQNKKMLWQEDAGYHI